YWIPKYPGLEHRFRAWNKSEKQKSPDAITNWSSSRIVFRWGVIRQLGMIDWPAPLVAHGLALLRDPDVRFVENVSMNEVTQFTDARVFEGLHSMWYLDLAKTKVRELEPLGALRGLENLGLFRTPVERIDALASSRLINLDLRSTAVTDLRPLANVKTLEFVGLKDTAVRDIEPLLGLPRLREVWLYGSKVSKAAAEKLEQAIESRVHDEPRCRTGLSDSPIVYGP
ncbi:MAG: hypothetical protein H0V17_23390, partial [Deltaproteobacteria bacterium]|nr:hypothetical protein [Deltaproteobacteria bacterium]